jgi:hypothetical protein
VYVPVEYELGAAEFARLEAKGLPVAELERMRGRRIASGEVFLYQVGKHVTPDPLQQRLLLDTAEIVDLEIAPDVLTTLDAEYLGPERMAALQALAGRRFDRRWKLEDALLQQGPAWQPREALPIHQLYNQERAGQLAYVLESVAAKPREEEDTVE